MTDRVVLISGCDTGFGNLTAKALDKLHYHVLAGCYTQEGMEKLDKETSDNVVVFHLDVTDEKSIDEAGELVNKHCTTKPLWAVINNAGVLLGCETELTSMATFRRVMDVNYFGAVALTKKVLPFIRKSKGRVINVASIAGRIAGRGIDAYSASKFAVIGWSDSLRQSLRVWGCKVITIEPGFMNTNIFNNVLSSIENDFKKCPEATRNDYGNDYLQNAVRMLKTKDKVGENPELVCEKIVRAVIRLYPAPRYVIGASAHFLAVPLSYLPIFLRDSISDCIQKLLGTWALPAALRSAQKYK